MTDGEFNRYCAEVMGYTWDVWASSILLENDDTWEGYKDSEGSPVNMYAATDLNQMVDVFDKLWKTSDRISDSGLSLMTLRKKGIAQAMREFIESTKGESE